MSSVSGSDRGRNHEQVDRVRKDYKQQAAKQEQRHAQQISRLTEQYAENIDELQENQDERLSQMRTKLNDEISERDRLHKAEIDRIRDVYKERLVAKVGEAENKADFYKADAKRQVSAAEAASDSRMNRMKGALQGEIEKQEKTFAERGQEMRAEVATSRDELQTKLNSKHQKDTDALREQQQLRVAALQKDLTSLKRYSETSMEDLDRSKSSENQRLRSTFETQIRSEREKLEGSFGEVREQFKQARTENVEKYQKALDERDEAQREFRKNLKDSVEGRLNSKVAKLESENQGLKEARVVDRSRGKSSHDIEKRNIARSYNNQLEDLREQKEQTLEFANKDRRESIDSVIRQKDKHFREAIQDKKEESQVARLINKEAREQMETNHRNLMSHVNERTDHRIDVIIDETQEAEKKLTQFFDENLELKQKNFDNSLHELRESNQTKMSDLRAQFAEKAREIESKGQKKLDLVKDQYEGQLAQLKDEQKAELGRQKERFETLAKERKKTHEYETQTQQMRFETKMEQIRENHDREIAQKEKAHREEMDAFIQQQKFASRNLKS